MRLYDILNSVLHIDLSGFTNTDIENVFREYETDEVSNAIDQWIHSERDRKILKRRLIDGICYEPLADEMQMSVRQIKDVISKCEWILFRHI